MLALAITLARRELRGGIRGFRVFLACLAIGVGAIAAVGSVAQSVRAGLERDARSILGGDIALRIMHQPATAQQMAYLARDTVAIAASSELRAMARAGDRRVLVELKAVDQAYPLFGQVEIDGGGDLQRLLAPEAGVFGAVIERALAVRLNIGVGDRVRVGDADFAVRGIVLREPDRGVSAMDFGPRLLIQSAALPQTGLILPGSLVEYHYKLRLPEGADSISYAQQLRRDWPEAPWRIRDLRQSAPGAERFITQIGLFLILVGLTTLLVGGVGVGNAVRGYLDGKTATIATLKGMGAPGGLVFTTYFVLVLLLSLVGIAAGLMLGSLAPFALAHLAADLLPVPLALGVYPLPLLLAGLFGVLTAIAFSVWPLGRARDVAAASLFRDVVAPAGRWPRWPYVAGTVAAVAALAILAVVVQPPPAQRLAAGFVVAALAAFALFRAAALAIMALARRLPRPSDPRLRLALANLHRPGAATPHVVLSLGLGLTVLVTVALIEGNLNRQITERLPGVAPSFFFIDLQSDQVAAFDRVVRETPGVTRLERVPSLRGRIIRINGVPVAQASIAPEVAWAVDNDRGLTYAAAMPPDARVVAGEWWPADYSGPPLISFDARIARGMGIGVGDTLTINVLGRDVTARIGSLREIDFTTLGINFTIIFAPGLLEAAPHTHLAVAYAADDAAEQALLRRVTDAFQNVSAIRVKDALDTVAGVIGGIAAAGRAVAAITLLAGTLVLIGALVAGHRRRVRDAVVLKVLGATRGDVLTAYLIEYGLLGLMTAVIASVLGGIGGWLVVTTVMRAEFVLLPWTIAVTAAACAALTILLGMIGTWRALGQKAAPVLRTA
ncbi:MAG: FtsX-like permease family protein [Alphaproteobacteria bacterium]|nr:MAG: FtsX-like permease family protein [Alphaproteobacteria bacterium]